MSKRNAILVLLVAALLGVGVWAAHRLAFDWASLRAQLRMVSPLQIAIGCACIYAGFVARAMRWAILMGPQKCGRTAALVAPQFIGFTAVALFGRLADLTRPYVIARRTNTPVAVQVAVYSVERIFDLAAAAILFSLTLALAPRGLPHREAFVRAGVISLGATLVLSVFALVIRFWGAQLAPLIAGKLRFFSPHLAETAAARILDFQSGLQTLRSAGELASVLGLSLLLWLGIAEAYVHAARAFGGVPVLAALTLTQAMLMMATSMGGSMVQLPVVGWFTQIALLAAAIHAVFGAPVEAATACAAAALFCTVLSVIPPGLVLARMSGASLRSVPQKR